MAPGFGKRLPPSAAPPRRLRSQTVVVSAIGAVLLGGAAYAEWRREKCEPSAEQAKPIKDPAAPKTDWDPEPARPARPAWCSESHSSSHSSHSYHSYGGGWGSGSTGHGFASSTSHGGFNGFGGHGSGHGGG
jgi:hypothetical protein